MSARFLLNVMILIFLQKLFLYFMLTLKMNSECAL